MRKLLGETKENNFLPNEGSLICPPQFNDILHKQKENIESVAIPVIADREREI